jgi:tRNA threonylcarbamoyl adenosine modification protein (Sua5/YciO/YrdC/YwlC family)
MNQPAIRYPTTTDQERDDAVLAAAGAIRRGGLVVIPTDTVYGIAADAFKPDAVQALLDAKGRGREMPPPVLVNAAATLDALATRIPDWARALGVELWPGALTLVCHQQPSLQWDLGETRGTVAVRVPDHPITKAVLDRTGPLAVSSANKTGQPAALDADQAQRMLNTSVEVIVDGGAAPGGEASTIVDATTDTPRLLRLGAISVERINAVLEPHGVALETGQPTGQPTTEPDAEPEPE